MHLGTEINLKDLDNKGLVIEDVNKFSYKKIEYINECIPDGYCLVEIKACGLGPYDIGHIIGRLTLNEKREFNLGCEGSGVVIGTGENCDNSLIGKRVAFLSDYNDKNNIMSFANFSIVNKNSLIILPENIDYNQGAYILANPLTAKALFSHVILKSKAKAIVQDTSSSSLGKMITKLCIKNNIKIINIVRKKENIQILKDIGSQFNLDSSSQDFFNDLENFINQLNPDIYISYQGGNLPSRIVDKMPFDSKMVTCGNINNEKLAGFSTTDFIFKGKSIEGFQILNYLQDISEEEKKGIYNEILKSLEDGNSEYFTNISKEYPIEDFNKGYEDYLANSSLGKIIFKP